MTPRTGYFLASLLAFSTWIACAPTEPKPAALSRFERRALYGQGSAAYQQKDFAGCASLFAKAGDPYMAACCHSLGGNREAAFTQLAIAIDGRYRDLPRLDRDADFQALYSDPRWASERARLIGKIAEDAKHTNAELQRIFTEDQADRMGKAYEQIDWPKVGERDKQRRQQVDAILAAGGTKVAADYYHAALVYQHGETPEEIQRARDLALKAVELDPEHDQARWLSAAAEDRKLMFEKKPQKWGTQFRKIDGVWVVWEVDPAITDAQRDEWNVPTLAEAQARAARMNAP